MKKRSLGNTGLLVSEIGLGCMSLGNDKAQAEQIIKTALDGGITYFDTADLYDFGENEEIVGSALKSVRDQVVIGTKVGNRWNEDKDSWKWDASADYIKEAVKGSLKRLQTDYIDLYQLHGGTNEDRMDETIGAFEDLKKAGYIRHYGISSIRPNVFTRYATNSSIASVMMQYSMLDRRPEEWMPLLDKHHIGIIARGPVAKGLLSEQMLNKASRSVRSNGYLDYSYGELEKLLPFIKDRFPERSLNEVALQYILAQSTVATVIPGASSTAQLSENIMAANRPPLTSEEVSLLKQWTKANRFTSHRD